MTRDDVRTCLVGHGCELIYFVDSAAVHVQYMLRRSWPLSELAGDAWEYADCSSMLCRPGLGTMGASGCVEASGTCFGQRAIAQGRNARGRVARS